MSDRQKFEKLPVQTQANFLRRLLRVAHFANPSFKQLAVTLQNALRAHPESGELDLSVLNEDNLKKFVAQEDDSPIRSSNRLLSALYEAIRYGKHDLPQFAREHIILLSDSFFHFYESEAGGPQRPLSIEEQERYLSDATDYNYATLFTYKAICRVLNVNPDHEHHVSSLLAGRYLMLRPSTLRGRVVLSQVQIVEKRVGDERTGIWEFIHQSQDQFGQVRYSDGLVLALRGRTYLLGDIERGQGLDVISLEGTSSSQSPYIFGLIMGEDVEGKAISSRIVGYRVELGLLASSGADPVPILRHDTLPPLGPMDVEDVDLPDSILKPMLNFLGPEPAIGTSRRTSLVGPNRSLEKQNAKSKKARSKTRRTKASRVKRNA